MLEIEALIADEPRLEGDAARRFPATPLNTTELSRGPNSKAASQKPMISQLLIR